MAGAQSVNEIEAEANPQNYLLALECCFEACSVALWYNGHIIAYRYQTVRRGHAAILPPMLEAVLSEGFGTLSITNKNANRSRLSGLKRVAVTIGPGGFTGLRIGIALAQGLALGCACPVIGVSSLEAVAEALRTRIMKPCLALIAFKTKRSDLYVQLFRLIPDLSDQPGPDQPGTDMIIPLTAPLALLPKILPETLLSSLQMASGQTATSERLLLAGDASGDLLPILLQMGYPAIRPTNAPQTPDAAFVARLAMARFGQADSKITPLYLRPPDVSLPPASLLGLKPSDHADNARTCIKKL